MNDKNTIRLSTNIMKSHINNMLYKIIPRYMAKRYWSVYSKTFMNGTMSDSYKLMYEDLARLCLREEPARILEYGCGYGYLLNKVSEMNKNGREIEFYGVDFSVDQIETAKKYFQKGNFFCCDITKGLDRFKEEEFDVVMGVGVFMYINPKFMKYILSELRRICKRKLFLIEYYYRYLSEEKKKIYDTACFFDGRYVHDYKTLLMEEGFKNITATQIGSFADNKINRLGETPHTLLVAEK